MHMRKGEWAEAAEISGIECVGIVKSCPGGEFAVGRKVAALMEANEANGKLVVRL
jgi:NADPH:quinone reductase